MEELSRRAEEAKLNAEIAHEEDAEKLRSDLETAKGNLAAARENLRINSEKSKSRFGAEALKAQMLMAKLREDRSAEKTERTRAKAQKAVEEAEDYAAQSISIALLSIDEATCAVLEAIDARLSYEEEYGEKK